MEIKMNFESLRRRNKKVLVEHAFNLYVKHNENIKFNKEYWVEQLIKGHNFSEFIEKIKTQSQLLEDKDTSKKKTASIGRIKSKFQDLTLDVGLSQKIKIELYNGSRETFITSAAKPLYLSYHWYKSNGDVYEFDGIRTSINQSVLKGDLAIIDMVVKVPKEVGNYIFLPTLVLEGKAWLENEGLEAIPQKVEVVAPEGPPLTRRAQNIFNSLKANAAA